MSQAFINQSNQLSKMMKDWVCSDDSTFVWSPGDTEYDTLTQYLVYFTKLQSTTHNPKEIKQVKARWRFIASWATNQYYFGTQPQLHGRLPWRSICDALVWNSRKRAIEEHNIDRHMSLPELINRRIWDAGPTEKTLREYVDERVEKGVYVVCNLQSDKKKKWVSLSVSAIIDYWILAMGGYLVRASFRDGRYGTSPNDQKKYWVEKLGMTGEIWDWAMERNWEVI